MKKIYMFIIFVFIIYLNMLFLSGCKSAKNLQISDSEELERIFSKPQRNLIVNLAPGNYSLNSDRIIDSTCGNCQDPDKQIKATAGLIISGYNITLQGPEDKTAIIYTNSGYGIFVKNCDECAIRNLTITGGKRDTSAMASDAAIVVKNSNAEISNNNIYQNLGDSINIQKNVVGIMGICGRENSNLLIKNNTIIRNSWDGIALYRDSKAKIICNKIDGVDRAGGRVPKGGRGVAIGVTWNAEATIKNNYITNYWKGIGIFVDAKCKISFNIIENLITWGIALWDAGKGAPSAFIENNIIYDNGACGVSITRCSEWGEPGFFKNNIITKTAQDSNYDSPDYYCYQCALAKHSVPTKFVIKNNLFHNNRRANNELPDYDVNMKDFLQSLKVYTDKFENNPYFKQSIFYQDFIRDN